MQALHEELWGNQVPIIKEFTVLVPQAKYGILSAYKISLRQSGSGSYIPPEFGLNQGKQVFCKLEAKAELPWGVYKFLLYQEYDLVYDLLIWAQSGEWSNVGSDDESETEEHSKIDY